MRPSHDPHARKPFRLLALGGAALVDAGGAVIAEQRRRLALLSLIAAGRGQGVSRDKLVSYLSPESSTDSARHALHQLLYYLRQQAGDDALLGTDSLRLNPDVITSDVDAFEGLLDQREFERAVTLYRGPFLDGFHVADSAAFEEWASAERARLAARHADALYHLAAAADASQDHSAAIVWWTRLAGLDPVSSRAVRGLISAHEAAGDVPAALRAASTYDTIHRAEFGTGPDAEFVAVVEAMENRGRAATTAERSLPVSGVAVRMVSPTPPIPVDVAPLIQEAPLIASRRVLRGWRMIGAGVLAAAVITSALVAIDGRRNSPLMAVTDDLLVGDIEAQPRDSLAALALTELLRVTLADTRVLRVVSRADIQSSLGRMLLPGNTRVDVTVARELAVRDGYEAILLAELTPVGRGYVISAHLQTVGGTELAAASEPASENELTAAVGRLSKSLRSRFGESRRTLRAIPPLEQVTTRSMRALTLYTQGQDAADGWRGLGAQPPAAMALWAEAIQADSTFAIAHRRLGVAFFNLGMTKEALQELRAADRFSGRLTDIERLAVRISLQGFLRDHNSAIAAAHAILHLDPNRVWETWARMQLTWQYRIAGQYDLLEKEYRTRGPVDGSVILWCALLAYQGHGPEALDSARAYFRRYQDSTGSVSLRSARYNLALMHALAFAYDSAIAHASPPGPTDYYSPLVLAASLYARGEFARAGAMPLSIPTKADGESFAAMAIAPNTSERALASQRAIAVFADSVLRSRDAANRPIRPILALALAGRGARARRELAVIVQAANADVLVVRRNEFELARGAIALAEHHPRDAIQAFTRASTSMDLASLDACRVCALPWLGRAYDEAGMPDSATVVYEHFLLTGDVNRYLADAAWRAVLLERLGALHAARGDTAHAVLRLSQFVELWKNADPALQPRVEKARQRLAELGDTSYIRRR